MRADLIHIAESPPRSSKNRKGILSGYNKSWEKQEMFKSWIWRSNYNLVYCKVCCELKALGGVSDLKAHALTSKHVERKTAVQIQKSSKVSLSYSVKYSAKISNIELHLAAFCAEHNVPFSAINRLVPLIQETIEDSALLKKQNVLE